jgi:K+/H+ antiporter YhaU regulatory subunit KhtT
MLKAGSVFSGKAIRDVPVRSETGVSIMAVSRAGKSFFDPGPDFRLYPGDRIVLLGEQQNLYLAEKYFAQREFERDGDDEDKFAVVALDISEDSPWVGYSLADLNFRSDYGATIIGIERDEKRITAPPPSETLRQNDRLFVAGSKAAVELLKQEQPEHKVE